MSLFASAYPANYAQSTFNPSSSLSSLYLNSAPVNPHVPAFLNNSVHNLPQPSPPAGWTITHGSTTVKQDFGTVEITYEYKYCSPGKEFKTLPLKISAPPTVPAHWTVIKSTFMVEKEDNSQMYKYVLKYSEPAVVPKSETTKI
jgi:hypothetical protein